MYQLGIGGIKKKVTYSVALIIAFLAGENENRQPGRFVTGQFFRLSEIFLLSVRTNSVNENFAIMIQSIFPS